MPDMVELFVAAPDGTIWAICSGGGLLQAAPDDWSWSSALPSGTDVRVKSLAFPRPGSKMNRRRGYAYIVGALLAGGDEAAWWHGTQDARDCA